VECRCGFEPVADEAGLSVATKRGRSLGGDESTPCGSCRRSTPRVQQQWSNRRLSCRESYRTERGCAEKKALATGWLRFVLCDNGIARVHSNYLEASLFGRTKINRRTRKLCVVVVVVDDDDVVDFGF